MEKNHSILKIGIILIGIIMILSTSFIYSSQLDSPVFLKHYYEQYIPLGEDYAENPTFPLQYITNTLDPRSLVDISFQEAPELHFYINDLGYGWSSPIFDDGNHIPGEKYGRYTMRRVNISLEPQSVEEDIERLTLSKANITLDNGETLEKDVGEIILYSQDTRPSHMEFSSSTGSSSDGTSYAAIKMQEDITLLEIDSPLMGDLDHLFDFKIEDTPYSDVSGMDYNNQDIMKVSTTIKPSQDDTDKFMAFDIRPIFSYEDSQGNIYHKRIRSIQNRHYYDYSFWEILFYVKWKEEI